LQVTTGGKGRGGENVQGPPISGHCQWRRLNPRAASDGRAWRGRAATIPADHRRLSDSFWIFWVYLVIFKLYLIFLNFCYFFYM
jgi:hypothetical protein